MWFFQKGTNVFRENLQIAECTSWCWKVKEICAETNFSSMDEKVFPESAKECVRVATLFERNLCKTWKSQDSDYVTLSKA